MQNANSDPEGRYTFNSVTVSDRRLPIGFPIVELSDVCL